MTHPIDENEHWILSFYRTSEISGALFFGRLSQTLRPGPIQEDMTKHFADEANHAWLWTQCMQTLGVQPMRLESAYQDQYVAAAGLPANLMEVLAITHVFEKRVIGQYSRHAQLIQVNPVVKQTLEIIMQDEKWHLQWILDALKDMEPEYGKDVIEATLQRFQEADNQVYQATMQEHEARLRHLAG